MITLIFMVYCVLFLKLKKKPQGKQLLNSWELSSSIWRTVNVDGRLDLFGIIPGAASWLHKQTDLPSNEKRPKKQYETAVLTLTSRCPVTMLKSLQNHNAARAMTQYCHHFRDEGPSPSRGGKLPVGSGRRHWTWEFSLWVKNKNKPKGTNFPQGPLGPLSSHSLLCFFPVLLLLHSSFREGMTSQDTYQVPPSLWFQQFASVSRMMWLNSPFRGAKGTWGNHPSLALSQSHDTADHNEALATFLEGCHGQFQFSLPELIRSTIGAEKWVGIET